MSWQAYVDNNLVGAGFTQAAIISAADGSVWAKSGSFNVPEGKAIAGFFAKPADASAQGITVNGVKYMTLKADNRSLYGKKNATGVVCVKTTTTVLVAVYDEKLQPGAAANIVEKLADYLIDNNC